MNIGLEIDDFGTGYSSLSYLRRLPFDTLKIDRSFIRELSTGSDGLDIVKAIVEMAHSLRLEVIAEGVETEEQLCRLRALGTKFVQGFLFSKPVDAEAAMRMYLETRECGFLSQVVSATLTQDQGRNWHQHPRVTAARNGVNLIAGVQ